MSSKKSKSALSLQKEQQHQKEQSADLPNTVQHGEEDQVPDLPPSRYASNASLSKRPSSTRSNRDVSSNGQQGKLSQGKASNQSLDGLNNNKKKPSSASSSPLTSPVEASDLGAPGPSTNTRTQQQQQQNSRRTNSVTSASSTGSVWTIDNDPLSVDDAQDRGRVKVFVRVRPMSTDEKSILKEENIININADHKQITMTDGKKDGNYSFDRVFTPEANHRDIFKVIGRPVVHSALKGFNGTLMAYGQTGTGKTHTLTSPDGLIPRLVNYLFRRVNGDSQYSYKVKCSCIQIYNEKIYDLLVSDKKKTSSSSGGGGGGGSGTGASASGMEGELNLRENPEKGVFVEDLTEYIVRSPKEVFELIKLARSRLVFAETKMNRASSRSHAITFLSVEKSSSSSSTAVGAGVSGKTGKQQQRGEDDGVLTDVPKYEGEDDINYYDGADDLNDDDDLDDPMSPPDDAAGGVKILNDYVLKGRITLCDLAGSERIKKTLATGDRLNEAQQINLSLLELGNVIHALTDPKRVHVPFRNSTLTRLLTESLGGNCLTRLIVCVGPCAKDLSETKGTLMFGMRAMRVKNNARVNMEIDYKSLAESLQRELREIDEMWRKKEAEWAAKVNEAVAGKVEQEMLERRAEFEGKLREVEEQLKQVDGERDRVKAQFNESQSLIEKMSTWMSVNDAKIWSNIQAAIYNLEQSVLSSTDSATYQSQVEKSLEKAKGLSAFTPKALSQLIDWMDEVNRKRDNKATLEKWTASSSSIIEALNGNLKNHVKALSSIPQPSNKELVECLEALVHGTKHSESPHLGSSSIYELLQGMKDNQNLSSLYFIAIVPLLLQYQIADRLSMVTLYLTHASSVASASTDSQQTQTHPRIPTKTNDGGTQTSQAKHEKDVEDEILDRKAQKKAANCVVGGKECSIM